MSLVGNQPVPITSLTNRVGLRGSWLNMVSGWWYYIGQWRGWVTQVMCLGEIRFRDPIQGYRMKVKTSPVSPKGYGAKFYTFSVF